MVPVVVLFGMLAVNLIALAFQRGAFNEAATHGTAAAALSYLGYIYVGALSGVTANALYSLKRMANVVALGIGGLALYVVLALLLVPQIGFMGVGIAASLSAVAVLAVYVMVLQARGVRLQVLKLIRYHLSVLPGATGVCVVAFVCKWVFVSNLAVVLSAGLLAPVVYLLAGWVVRNSEARLIAERLRSVAHRLVMPRGTA